MSVDDLEKLRLELNPDELDAPDGGRREYDIYPIESVDISTSKDAFSVAPPGLSARENILLGISGMQADISISAWVYDDGSDRANGTHTSNVVGMRDQLRYLEDTMHAPDFSAAWTLDHPTGGAFDTDDVFLESIDMTSISQASPKWKQYTLRLRRGQSIG